MELITPGLKNAVGSIDLKFLPSQVPGLKLWTRFNSGITVTGSGVSQWDDQSGNGNHLKQATDANRMTKEADGSILGNGVDQFLKADAFTFTQPETVLILGKQVTWTISDHIIDGNTTDTGAIFQRTSTPNIGLWAGAAVGNVSLSLDTYGVIAAVINGASSSIQINNGTPATGNAGASNMSGFVLGARADLTNFANYQAKEIVAYSGALDAATLSKIIAYLATVGGLSI